MEIVGETITTILWNFSRTKTHTKPAGLEFGSPNTKIELLFRGPGRTGGREFLNCRSSFGCIFFQAEKMNSKIFFEPGQEPGTRKQPC